jgi:hypothetical protein
MATARRSTVPRSLIVGGAVATLVVLTSSAAMPAFSPEPAIPSFGTGSAAYVDDTVSRNTAGQIVQIAPPAIGGLAERPSLRFARGGYEKAVTAIYLSRARGIAVPSEATLGAPLPQGKVINVEADGSIEIDPSAPTGYDPTSGRVIDATFSMPGDLSESELRARIAEAKRSGQAVPRGGWVTALPIPRCQILYGRAAPSSSPGCDEPGADRTAVMP